MIEMQKIEITRAEGPLEGAMVPVDHTFTAERWQDANEILRCIALDKRLDPHDTHGCYDKTDFKVYFEDGETYEGRADVKADGDDTNLLQHINEFMGFLAGDWRPGHLSDDQWDRVRKRYEADGTAKDARAFLATYDIPNWEG